MTIKIIHSPSLPDDIKAIREQRKEVCQTCEYRRTTIVFDICLLCKCPIFKKIKRDNDCPLNRWR